MPVAGLSCRDLIDEFGVLSLHMQLSRKVAEETESCSRRGRNTQILMIVGISLILQKQIGMLSRKKSWNERGGTGSEGRASLCTGMHGGKGYQMGQSIRLMESPK